MIDPVWQEQIRGYLRNLTEEEAVFAVEFIAEVHGVSMSPGNGEAREMARQRAADEADPLYGKPLRLVLISYEKVIDTIRVIRTLRPELGLAEAKKITDAIKTGKRAVLKRYPLHGVGFYNDFRLDAKYDAKRFEEIGCEVAIEVDQ